MNEILKGLEVLLAFVKVEDHKHIEPLGRSGTGKLTEYWTASVPIRTLKSRIQ